jgi:hypothetical protein
MVDVDEGLTGGWHQQCEGEMRGAMVEAPGSKEIEAVTPDDEVMCHEKVTGRLQCDRSGSGDMT